ncbi:homoserine dehydrogenase [Kocuria sediminis]|uniref:Homoserine dehydrogenase n=2 Tax=Kocuria TaxID=57493 RepID=A0A512I8M5_9MICC|nr:MULTISPECIES: homoserine dehydrogenase [Kocuria]MUN61744.1 homoserine dehydrogenase [Kocuria sediminis]GEO94056.1 homoserine dehydrogenase [Kocuria turfanensis]
MSDSTPATPRPTTTVKVALLGAGNVGAEVARILLDHSTEMAARVGAPIELAGIAVRDLAARRTVELPEELFTTDAEALIDAADVVIELTGGIEPARSRILRALHAGKPVISGNKALIARHGRQLQDAADDAGVPLSYEAAVAGAIPIVRPMADSLAGDRVDRVLGIMNGTTNYILDQMDTTGAQFDDALAEAQRLGYAEADPTADVEGHDAAAKAAILASLAFHSTFTIDDVYCRGITGVTAEDVAAAAEAGYVIKLLAVCERCAGGVNLRVTPTMIPREHPLAGVHGAYNAVFVEAANAGSLMFYGAGAGGAPTASAVLGDFVSAARRLVLGAPAQGAEPHAQLPAVPMDDVRTSFSITLTVQDRLGVLARIAQVFADHGVSIYTMQQKDDPHGTAQRSEIRLVTHRGTNKDLTATVEALRELPFVEDVTGVIRVEHAD